MEAFDYVSGFDTGYDDTGSFFGSIGHAFSSAARAVSHPFVSAAHAVEHEVEKIPGVRQIEHAVGSVTKLARKGLHALTANPIWDIAATGVSFIPGIGNAVSAGMAGAAAFGRGASLSELGLAAARGALPGGPAVQAGFDIGIGALRGHNLTADLLHQVRAQLPVGGVVGEMAKGAFDAAVVLEKNLPGPVRDQIRARLSSAAKHAFDTALNAKPAPMPVAPSKATRSTRTMVHRMPRVIEPPNRGRPFPALAAGPNKVAATLLTSQRLRSAPAPMLAQNVGGATPNDARTAIAAFLQRFSKQRAFDWRDVGEYDSLDRAASRHNVEIGSDLCSWPMHETGALEVLRIAPIGLSRAQLHALYRTGDDNIKRSILAHSFLAHHARNTGELEGTTWKIQGNGDWPYVVASKVVGSGSRYLEIASVNPTMSIYTDAKGNKNLRPWNKGQVVQLPPSWFPGLVPTVAAPVSQMSSSAPVGGPPFSAPSQYPNGYPSATYIVKAGDTGEKIAALITGNKGRWEELLASTGKKRDPKYGIAVYPNERLTLPASWVTALPAPQIVVTTQPAQMAPPAPVLVGMPDPKYGNAAYPVSPPPNSGGVVNPIPPQALPPVPAPSFWQSSAPVQSQPAIIGTQEQIATLEIMLAHFFRAHPEAAYTGTGGSFGTQPADFAGVWSPRIQDGVHSFQLWANAQGIKLQTDGLPDAATVAALQQCTAQSLQDSVAASSSSAAPSSPAAMAAAASSAAPAKKSDGPGLLLLAALPFLFG